MYTFVPVMPNALEKCYDPGDVVPDMHLVFGLCGRACHIDQSLNIKFAPSLVKKSTELPHDFTEKSRCG